MKLIKRDQHAVWFLQPVDPERDGAPNYFSVIKHPMDLGTIQAIFHEISLIFNRKTSMKINISL